MMKNMVFRKMKVKGAVLFTVVAVMAVMIIFLLATLSVVMAVQKRTVSDYSSSQSYYTARSAVDSVRKAMCDPNDQNLAKAIYKWGEADNPAKVKQDGEKNIPAKVTPIEMKGLPVSMGEVTELSITRLNKTVLNGANKEVVVFKIQATARVGNEESTVREYIYNGESSIPSSPGTPFVTRGMADAGTNAPIYGTAIFSLDKPNQIELTNASQLAGSLTCYGNATTGTSSAYYMLGTGDGMVIYNNFDKDYGNLSLDNTIAVIGNLNLKVGGATTYAGAGLTDKASSTTLTCVTTEQLKNIRDYKLKNGMDLIPFIYCDNVLEFGDSASRIGFANPSKNIYAPVNIYCGSVNTKRYNNELGNGINGDIFCYDEGATSVFHRTNQNNIIGWVANTLDTALGADTTLIGGSMYTKGSISITAGNWVVNGDLYVKGNITVNGGTLTVNGKCNKAGYGTHDAGLKFPKEMDTYTVGGKTYPGVVEHKTENKDGFVKSYEDLYLISNLDRYQQETTKVVGGASLRGYLDYSRGTVIKSDTKFPSSLDSNDNIVVDITAPVGTIRSDLSLYFPDGLTWNNGGGMTVNNLVLWKYKTDAGGYVLDANGKRATKIEDAAIETLNENNKEPIQRPYACKDENGKYALRTELVYVKMVIGDQKNVALNGGQRILTEYYASRANSKLHVHETGDAHREQIPCIKLYMENGVMSMSNNAIVSAYAICPSSVLNTNTSGSQIFEGSTYSSKHDGTVEVNSTKGGYILWIGSFIFDEFRSANDGGLLFVEAEPKPTVNDDPDFSSWPVLLFDD